MDGPSSTHAPGVIKAGVESWEIVVPGPAQPWLLGEERFEPLGPTQDWVGLVREQFFRSWPSWGLPLVVEGIAIVSVVFTLRRPLRSGGWLGTPPPISPSLRELLNSVRAALAGVGYDDELTRQRFYGSRVWVEWPHPEGTVIYLSRVPNTVGVITRS